MFWGALDCEAVEAFWDVELKKLGKGDFLSRFQQLQLALRICRKQLAVVVLARTGDR